MSSISKWLWISRLPNNDQSFKMNRKQNFNNIIENYIQNVGIYFKSKQSEIQWTIKISIVSFLITNFTQLTALFMAKDDPKKLLSCFSVFTFCAMGFLKLLSLFIYQKRWRSLIMTVSSLEIENVNNNELQCEYESEDEDNYLSSRIDFYIKQFHTVSTNLSRIYFFTAMIFMASPFIEYGIKIFNESIAQEYPHFLQGWAPLDFSIFGYSATILAEAISAIYCVKVHTAFDLTAIGLMIFIGGQFSLLHKISEYIGGKGNTSTLSQRRDERAQYRIIKCHRIHVSLLKCTSELGKLVQNILGIYFFVATLTLCSVAVQLQWEHLSATQIISLLQYMCATLTQLFLFCHYGDAVFSQSSVSLGEGPFCAASWCLSMKIRRQVAILCIGMSQPCRILAGPFNSLDLPSFIQIVRAAYSIYAVLRHTSE